MKKLFAIIAMFGVFAFGATQAMMAQTDEAAAAESDSAAAMVDNLAVETSSLLNGERGRRWFGLP